MRAHIIDQHFYTSSVVVPYTNSGCYTQKIPGSSEKILPQSPGVRKTRYEPLKIPLLNRTFLLRGNKIRRTHNKSSHATETMDNPTEDSFITNFIGNRFPWTSNFTIGQIVKNRKPRFMWKHFDELNWRNNL